MATSYPMSFDRDVLVAVDYDGTITDSNGQIDKEAVVAVKEIQRLGVKIALWTCRENGLLEEALSKLLEVNISPAFVNTSSAKRPDSRKINADFYIDDRATLNGVIDWQAWIKRIKDEVDKR